MTNTFQWNQLAGALGVLKTNGHALPWAEIDQQLRTLAAAGAESDKTVRELHRKYRDMCLERHLIEPGYLFNEHDCIPLI